MKRHAYARYMIEIALEIERRRSNHASLPPDVRAKALRLIDELKASDAVLVRDAEASTPARAIPA